MMSEMQRKKKPLGLQSAKTTPLDDVQIIGRTSTSIKIEAKEIAPVEIPKPIEQIKVRQVEQEEPAIERWEQEYNYLTVLQKKILAIAKCVCVSPCGYRR